jgi:hypothetical protein
LTKQKKSQTFNDGYCLIHIDQRWEQFPLDVSINLKEKILILSKSTNIVISSNIGGNKVFEYLNNELLNKPDIEFINDPNLHDTISLVYNSKSCISWS